jgi:hypothetical protein
MKWEKLVCGIVNSGIVNSGIKISFDGNNPKICGPLIDEDLAVDPLLKFVVQE